MPAGDGSLDHTEPESREDLYTDLSVNSLVELTLNHRSLYGIIRWIGTLPERDDVMAGIELVKALTGD